MAISGVEMFAFFSDIIEVDGTQSDKNEFDHDPSELHY